MNHDITHCNASDCKHKDSCMRYLAHLDAIGKPYNYLTYVADPKELDCYKPEESC